MGQDRHSLINTRDGGPNASHSRAPPSLATNASLARAMDAQDARRPVAQVQRGLPSNAETSKPGLGKQPFPGEPQALRGEELGERRLGQRPVPEAPGSSPPGRDVRIRGASGSHGLRPGNSFPSPVKAGASRHGRDRRRRVRQFQERLLSAGTRSAARGQEQGVREVWPGKPRPWNRCWAPRPSQVISAGGGEPGGLGGDGSAGRGSEFRWNLEGGAEGAAKSAAA